MRSRFTRSLLAGIVALATAVPALSTETPEYDVQIADKPFEVRDYGPMIVAQTTTDGDMDKASNQAFRRLAGYIFGDNVSRSSGSEEPESIAMTAPVTTVRSGDRWVTRFMMPAEYSMESLPVPNDTRVETIEDPGGRFAVVRFSGFWSDRAFEQRLTELEAWIAEQGLEAIGEPVIARYDPPWTPWFMRRNEILIPLSAAPKVARR